MGLISSMAWPFLWLGCVTLLPCGLSDLIIYSRSTHDDVALFEDVPSKFGGSIPSEGVRGLIVYASPALACSAVVGPPRRIYNYGNWILLIQRGNCSFEDKVRNAQLAGYNAAIVHNVNSSDLEPMGPNDVPDIFIPSVFIGSDDAEMIQRHYLYNSTYFAVIHDLPFDLTIHMLLIFSILVGLCFLGMVIFIVIKYFKDRRRSQRQRLPNSSLRRLPIQKYKRDDPFDTCVICLEQYVEGDKLRVLPCMHDYHVKCIDTWLTNNRRVCPVCKRQVNVGNEQQSRGDSDSSDSDSDSDTQPLLSGNPRQSDVFERARRQFVGLAESVASSISSAAGSFIDEREHSPSFHSVAENVSQHSVSLREEPSVNA